MECPNWSGWWVLESSGDKLGLKRKGGDNGIHCELYLVSLRVLDFMIPCILVLALISSNNELFTHLYSPLSLFEKEVCKSIGMV